MIIKKIKNLKFVIRNCQKGMTYVELIVVLSIFAMMSAIVMYNYGEFQAKIDIKNLASDIALKVVEAQKASLSGKLPPTAQPSTWKPSYGVYFNSSTSYDADGVPFNKKFIYFYDTSYDGYSSGEILDTIFITKGNFIDKIEICDATCTNQPNPMSITFKRPDSSAKFTIAGASVTGSQYVRITIKSPKGSEAHIKIYPSGRVQVN